MNKKDKHQEKDTKKVDKINEDEQNTKGDGNMENVIKREDQYFEKNVYKEANDKKVVSAIEKYTKKYNKALKNLAK